MNNLTINVQASLWLPYDRRYALPPLLPTAVADDTVDGRLELVRALRAALGAERDLARQFHPTYSASRHAALLRACRHEETGLLKLIREELSAISGPSAINRGDEL